MNQKYKISTQLEKCNQAQAISRDFIEIICLASEKKIIIIIDYTCKSREIYEMTVNITWEINHLLQTMSSIILRIQNGIVSLISNLEVSYLSTQSIQMDYQPSDKNY